MEFVLILGLVFIGAAAAVNPPPSGCTLVTPKPNNTICGENGSVTDRGYRDKAKFNDISNCLDLCGRHVCASFGFNATNGHCTLFDLGLTEGTPGEESYKFTPNNTSKTTYYDMRCFDCPKVCPQQEDINLLDNGGFEYSSNMFLKGPWGTPSASFAGYAGDITHPGRKSKNAFQCPGFACQLNQDYRGCPGQMYTLTFDYKADPSHHVASPQATLAVGDFYGMIFLPKAGLADWNHFEAPFQGFDTDELRYWIEHHLILDNVKIVPFKNFTVKPSAPNILINGDFESGVLTPWGRLTYGSPKSSVSVVSPGIGSNYKVEWKATNSYDDAFVYQTVSTKPGSRYLLSFDYFSPRAGYSGVMLSQNGQTITYFRPGEKNMVTKVQIPYHATGTELEIAVGLENRAESRGAIKMNIDNVDFRKLV